MARRSPRRSSKADRHITFYLVGGAAPKRGLLTLAHASRRAYDRWLGRSRRWAPRILVVAALHYATLMALPLTMLGLGSKFAALPVAAGFVIEVVRSFLRRGLKRQVRSTFLREAAQHALDKRSLLPEADVESAFWAAQLTEYALTVDIPALLAASAAGACVLLLAATRVSGIVTLSLLMLLLSSLGLTLWGNSRRAAVVDAVVQCRQRAAGWVAAAERDSGEIHGERARVPFLARLTESVRLWSSAEDQLDRNRLLHRLLLGALFLVGVLTILWSQHIDPLNLAPSHRLSTRSISGLLLLGTGAPIGYVFTVHADSLLTCNAWLDRLLPYSVGSLIGLRSLERRPARLTARALSFSYSTASSRPVLVALDFDADLSRITLVAAPNGAGKTTLAALICGLLVPNSGTLEVDGIACNDVSRDDFGFVPQSPLIIETLSIEDNVRLVAPDASVASISELLLELGLRQPIRQLAGELSRGEQRRVAIGRAILKGPRLLLLDEPDVWLDAEGRARLVRVLDRQLVARAVVVISHRRDWLPDDATVIDLEHQSPSATANVGPRGTSSAWG